MESYNIFLVEDAPWYTEILIYCLSLNPDYQVTHFSKGEDLLANLYKKPDLISIDLSLPDFQGDQLYKKIRAVNDQVPIIVISGQEDIAVAVSLLKSGVYEYILKDENTNDLLWNTVIKIRENSNLKKEVEHLKEELNQKFSFDKHIKGQSAALQKIFALMNKATQSNINISITGETGTGKEVVAKAIHYNSSRKKKNFVAVNMAAIPKELIESELFGHEKGAFTGAVSRKLGKFEEANLGTIFLDEIAELDLSLQNKLLRVLQEREVVKVGGNENVKLDVRLIVATHKNLAEEVRKGKFREDLYYRIIGLPIELPPLRDRGNDVLVLSRYFMDEYARENKLGSFILSADAKEKLLRYNYPGNIRELKSMIELAMVMCEGKEIKAADISYTAVNREEAFLAEEKTLRQYTCDIISLAMKKHHNNIALVAEKLGIGKSTIYQLIQKKEINL